MYRNLSEAAKADSRILNILASDVENTAAAASISALSDEFSTSEASVRRWREKWLELMNAEATIDQELAEDVGTGLGLDAPESAVAEGWDGFGDDARGSIHRRLDAALDAVNASPENIAGLRVSTYQSLTKDEEGEAHIHDLYAVKLLVKTKEAEPEWPLVQQAPPTVVRVDGGSGQPVDRGEWKTAIILPDIQAGFYTDNAGNLHPTHDPVALDVALQILAEAKPDTILVGGDGVDFPELSKYRLSPMFARTTQATIDWVEAFAATLRALAPQAAIEWIEGNHEMRLSNYILDNAKAAFGIKQANAPESWPVFSLPFLSRFDEHGVTYHAGYPAAEYWFNDRLKAMHGHKVNSTGSTVHRYLGDERVSTISFHIHRREWGERTRETRYGARTIMAASPGCLCRIDGAVPSTKGGMDLNGVPIPRAEDWQQGLALVHYKDGDAEFVYEQIAIHDGWAMFHGREFRARPYPSN